MPCLLMTIKKWFEIDTLKFIFVLIIHVRKGYVWNV